MKNRWTKYVLLGKTRISGNVKNIRKCGDLLVTHAKAVGASSGRIDLNIDTVDTKVLF